MTDLDEKILRDALVAEFDGEIVDDEMGTGSFVAGPDAERLADVALGIFSERAVAIARESRRQALLEVAAMIEAEATYSESEVVSRFYYYPDHLRSLAAED